MLSAGAGRQSASKVSEVAAAVAASGVSSNRRMSGSGGSARPPAERADEAAWARRGGQDGTAEEIPAVTGVASVADWRQEEGGCRNGRVSPAKTKAANRSRLFLPAGLPAQAALYRNLVARANDAVLRVDTDQRRPVLASSASM